MRHVLGTAAALSVALLAPPADAETAVKVLSASPFGPVLTELAPAFEAATGHSLALEADSVGAVLQRIAAEERFDLAIAIPGMIEDLVGQGRIAEGSSAAIARDRFALAIPAGAEPPDITTSEGFRQALLEAGSVAVVVGGAAGRPHFDAVFDRLGLAEAMEPKIHEVPSPGAAVEAVRGGEAELGFMVGSVVLAAEGVDSAGPLPEEAQFPIVFTAGVVADAEAAEGAEALIEFLRSPEAAEVIKAHGMEPEES